MDLAPANNRRPTPWLRLFGIAAAVAVGMVGLLILMQYSWMVPRPVRRRIQAWGLQGMLVAHGLVLVAAPTGAAVSGGIFALGRRRGVRRPIALRMFVLSVSGLIGLAMAETGASAWRAWVHRFPRLPTAFASDSASLDRESRSAPQTPAEILIIGESSARGDPYSDPYHADPGLSVGTILGWHLQRAIPDRRFHVENMAVGGATLEQEHQRLEGVKRRPDVLIVYAGHNEFFSRFGSDRAVPPDDLTPSLRSRLFEVRLTPLGRMIREAIARTGVDIMPRPRIDRQLVDWPVCPGSERTEIRDKFMRRLEAIVAYTERIGALPILVIPPGNDGGYEPNRSVPLGVLSPDEAAAVAREFQAARVTEDADAAHSLARYRAFLKRQPRFAEAHFRAARMLERLGDYEAAYREYILARDFDGYPQRCPSDIQDTYRVVASRHPRAMLIDGQAVFHAIGRHGLLDDHLFHDGVHPNLVGYVALAQKILDELHARSAFGWPSSAPVARIDPAECVEHFGIDAQRWAYICVSSARFYERSAYARFDPSNRLARMDRYWEASRQLLAGRTLEQIDLPGLRIHSLTADAGGPLESGTHSAHDDRPISHQVEPSAAHLR